MEKPKASHTVQGNWRGKYYYAGDSTAHGFEAVFVDIKGLVEGNILDDDDLGEAVVAGSFGYPELEFSKRYMHAAAEAITYHGTMSEDGKMLSGNWHIGHVSSGTWMAVREDNSEELNLKNRLEAQRELVVSKPKPVLKTKQEPERRRL